MWKYKNHARETEIEIAHKINQWARKYLNKQFCKDSCFNIFRNQVGIAF